MSLCQCDIIGKTIRKAIFDFQWRQARKLLNLVNGTNIAESSSQSDAWACPQCCLWILLGVKINTDTDTEYCRKHGHIIATLAIFTDLWFIEVNLKTRPKDHFDRTFNSLRNTMLYCTRFEALIHQNCRWLAYLV